MIAHEPLTPYHAALLAGMHRVCFADPWDEKAMRDLLVMPGSLGWLAAGHLEHFPTKSDHALESARAEKAPLFQGSSAARACRILPADNPDRSENALSCPPDGKPSGGGPQGFILLRTAADEAEILTLLVLPPYRRRGVAAGLLNQAMIAVKRQGAAKLFLEVAETNLAARAIYIKSGFHQVGLRRGYYSGGANALIMQRGL